MKQIILTSLVWLFLFMVISKDAKAQKAYDLGVGLRAGNAYALTVKKFINDKGAVEGLGIVDKNYYGVSGLYEHHLNVSGIHENFNVYGGVGAHVGVIRLNNNYIDIGPDVMLGVEMTALKRLTFGIDWRPNYNFIGDYRGFQGSDWGLFLRFNLK